MILQVRHTRWVCAVIFIAACNKDSKNQAKSQSGESVSATAASSPNRVQDSAESMSGMDHSNMPGMQPSSGAKPAGTGTDGVAPMAGMDHSKMDMTPAASGATPRRSASNDMAGMDHSKMNMTPAAPGAAPRRAAATDMPGMDHSKMDMGPTAPVTTRRLPASTAVSSMAGMNHGNMQANPARGTPTESAMSGMDHSQMGGTQTPAMTATQIADLKLQQLAAMLVKDPEILRRVQADSILRNRWSDARVRTQISAATSSERK